MAKKKKPAPPKNKAFSSNPFSTLKGFSVSDDQQQETSVTEPAAAPPKETIGSFSEEMAMLGVERLASDSDEEHDSAALPERAEETLQQAEEGEEELFLHAMGELQVTFNDSYPDEDTVPIATPRRMKQLKQGKLVPEATLDLHGLKRFDVAPKLQFFLQNAQRQGWRTLLVITGRGLHSNDGEPVLRKEAERFLQHEGRRTVAEWGRAPKQFGGEGALVLFLRENER